VLITRLNAILKAQKANYEIILVDDGSRDDTWMVIQSLAAQHNFVHGFTLMRNSGQHNALLCGIRTAQHDVIVTLDDDLQNPPEEIPRLLAKLDEGFDVVYGTPAHMQHGLMRNLASQLTKLALQGSMGVAIATKVSAFRAFRRVVAGAFAGYTGAYVLIDVLLTWGTTRFAAVDVQHDPRTIGVSNYTIGKLIRHALNMITGFSVLPLQIASILGFVFMGFGFLVIVFVVGRLLITGESVPGFPFLASIIAIFSGVQLFALGIIGEYLARMHVRLMGKSAYTIRDQTISAQAAKTSNDPSEDSPPASEQDG
jgi:undecaprenyl-phosphate 4-deoxy-4-formamido-L-arabinose transferase